MSEAGRTRHRVLLLIDEQTPMEFVIYVLENFFDMDAATARARMLWAHSNGSVECGIYPHDQAVQLVTDVVSYAREHQHPLQCIVEEARNRT
jgi:ATP-dependent Clp protease adaptor protein ClpS